MSDRIEKLAKEYAERTFPRKQDGIQVIYTRNADEAQTDAEAAFRAGAAAGRAEALTSRTEGEA
jgi:hypothetical protein